jgi:hypothetical protein
LSPFSLLSRTSHPGERNKVLGHASSDVGDRNYLLSITSVDVRTDHIAKLRGVSTKRAPDLPQALPAKEMINILNDPTVIELYRDLCQLRKHGTTENNVKPNESIKPIFMGSELEH